MLKSSNAGGRGEKADMVFKRREIRHRPMLFECRHHISNSFLSLRRCRSDGFADGLEQCRHPGRTPGDVLVDGGKVVGNHFFSDEL